MHRKSLVLFALLALVLGTGAASAATYQIDAAHSDVGFTIRHIVSRVSGHFNDFTGTVEYDAAHPEKTMVDAVIQVSSVDTGNERRDSHLTSPDFFNAEKFPTISFKSTHAEMKDGMLHLTGDFTMHGVTKKMVLPVEVLGTGIHPMNQAPVAGFSTELTLKRSEFGVDSWTDAAGVLGDDVKVTINIEAAGEPPKQD